MMTPLLQAESMSEELPPLRTLQSALRNTTETLAQELAHPTATTPTWSAFEWQVARAVCAMHGVSALLASGLLWQGPPQWTRFLCEQKSQTTRRFERIRELLASIDERARNEGVAMVALKGAALHSLGIYEPGERPMADVDLLVRPRDAARAAQVIEALGFHQTLVTPRHRVFVRDAHRRPSSLGEHTENYLKIELHERITEALPLRITDVTDLIYPREPHGGLNAYPSKAALMVHLLLHAAGSMSFRAIRLLHLNDLARLSARMSAAEWDQALELGKSGRQHWWALPPLRLTARYYTGAIPSRVLDALSGNSRWLLSQINSRRALSDVSFSYMWIDAFPGIEWSQSVLESVQYAAKRFFPDKDLLVRRHLTQQTEVALAHSRWHQSSQAKRLLRWIVSKPPRAETMHTVRAALERAT